MLTRQIIAKKNNLDLYKRNFAGRLTVVSHKPLEIFLEMSNSCNIKCVMCANTVFKSAWGKDISRTLIEKVVGAFESAIVVSPFGLGEPMVHGDFMWTLERAKLAQAYVSFFTNGTLLTREKAQRIVELGVDQITFSIDGAKRETFEKIRQGANFDIVMKRIQELTEVKKAEHAKPELFINFIAMETNLKELPELVRLAKRLGVICIHVKALETHNIRELEEMKKSILSESDHNVLREAKNVAKDLGIGLDLETMEAHVDLNKVTDIIDAHEEPHARVGTCFMPWRTIYVRYDGKVAPCCFGTDDIVIGDLNEESVEDIWNGAKMQGLRSMWNRGDIPARCSHCTRFPTRPKNDTIEDIFHKLCADPSSTKPLSRGKRSIQSLKSIVVSILR